MSEPLPGVADPAATLSLIEREARIVGIKDFTTPTLEAVDRRRSQLWTLAFAGLVCLSVAVALLTTQSSHHLGFANGGAFRAGTVLLVVGLAIYVIEKERHLRRLARLLTNERVLAAALSNRLKELAVLYEAGKAMNSVLVVNDVLNLILSSALELLEGSCGAILLVDETGKLDSVCSSGDTKLLLKISDDAGLRVMNDPEPLLIQPVPGRDESQSSVYVPLVHRGELLGVLALSRGSDHVFSEHDLRAVSLFAEHAAISVANARLYEAERELSARLETRVEIGTAELRAREARFSALVQNSSDLVTVVDQDSMILFQSASVERSLGWRAENTLGTSLVEAIHEADRQHWHSIADVLGKNPGGEVIAEWRVRHADGPWHFLQSVVTNRMDEPSVGGFVLNSRDISDQKALEDQLRHEAFHDPLTGLANRALFGEHLDQALRRRSRIGGGLALLFVDLDSFKSVNDLYGHAIGDELLKQMAERLERTHRDADTIARLGGDEFALLFEGVALDSYPQAAAERLIESLGEPFRIGSTDVSITASLGMAVDESGTETAEDLLRNADLAMYAAKTKNKGRYEIFSSSMHSKILSRMQVESDLRRAIDQSEFEAYYQPIVDFRSNAIGCEALIRWNHPKRGIVMPTEFIGVAEDSEMILQIGRWMLERACQEFSAMTQHVVGGEHLSLSVNLSTRQLSDPTLVDVVLGALAGAHLDAKRLTLEITESTIMEDLASAIAIIERLRSLGVHIAIDDFGTGHSSLSLLSHIPVDTLKIDRAFVADIGLRPKPIRLIRAVLLLANDFGLGTVAEGVETLDQLHVLQELGCEAAQGFYISKPKPAKQLAAMLQGGSHVEFARSGGRS